MKTAAMLLFMLAAGVAAGDTETNTLAVYPLPSEYWYMTNATITTNTTIDKNARIRAWAADGSICAVLGHQWLAVWIDTAAIYEPNVIAKRKCGVCGKVETKREEWK